MDNSGASQCPLSGDAEKADNQATLAKLATLSQDGCDQAAAGSEALSDLALFDAWKVALGTCTTTLASHLDTPLGSQPMSLGAASSREFRSISPDCMSRSSSAWDGTGPPTNCGAPTISMTAIHAAAASAQMLPLEVQALIRQQQAASLAGSLPRAAPGELQQRAAPSPFESGAGSFKSQPSLKGLSQPYSGQPMPVQPASGWAPPPAAACSTTAQLPAPSASQRPEGALLLLKSLLHRHQQNQQQQLYEQQQLLQQKQAQLAQLLHPALLGQPAVNNTCSVQFPLSQQYQQYVPQAAPYFQQHCQVELDPPESLLGLGGAYQPYCRQVITERLNADVSTVLTAAKLMQINDTPTTVRIFGRRVYCSLKEVAKVVSSARLIIVAPDVRVSPTAKINPVRAVQRILKDAEMYGVPVAFALSRRGIGQVLGRDKMMSIVAIMQLDGLEDTCRDIAEEAATVRRLAV
ncbi:hypothetical protein D9Q98_008148 [Chlorella vulgaris]|uniref:Ribosomal protein L7Ae/L30e/S12e/Gadd45 domain-containing protein n=1 Tax=Chlorella vulgaris TaxID=3077 RepID=A0A9D4TG36_CHLVU|nr:hypothetical protein D9Q98_008148 [Chlorella vulgaris]